MADAILEPMETAYTFRYLRHGDRSRAKKTHVIRIRQRAIQTTILSFTLWYVRYRPTAGMG